MVVSKFEVSYSVLDCGYGLPRPTGYYEIEGQAPMSARVDTEQVMQGTYIIALSMSTLYRVRVVSRHMRYCMSLMLHQTTLYRCKKLPDQYLVTSTSLWEKQLYNFHMISPPTSWRISCLHNFQMKEVCTSVYSFLESS